MKLLPLIFIIISLIFIIDADPYFYKCSDKDTKLSHVCAIKNENSNTLYIFNKCSKRKKCVQYKDPHEQYTLPGNGSLYTCSYIIEKKEHESWCHYDAECKSNLCSEGYCIYKKLDEYCTSSSNCGPGKNCVSKHCAKLLKIGEDCSGEEASQLCPYGSLCHSNVCTKVGTIGIGNYSGGDEMMCTTGVQYGGICDQVTLDLYLNQTDGKYYIKYEKAGLKEIDKDNVTFTSKGDCYYSDNIAKARAFANYKKELDDEDLEDYYDDQYLDFDKDQFSLGKKKYKKLLNIYKNSGILYKLNLINLQGDTDEQSDDDECIFEYIIKNELGSVALKLSKFISIILFFLAL